MTEQVPITPSVLTWFISDGCIDRDRLCDRVGIHRDRLTEFERGTLKPTKDEWYALAEALRRPTAAFLLPRPPTRKEMRQFESALDRAHDALDDAFSEALLGEASRVALGMYRHGEMKDEVDG